MSKLATQWEKQLQDPAFVLMKTEQVRDDKWKVTRSAPMSWRMLTMHNKLFDHFQIRKFWIFCTCFILFFAPYSCLWVLCDGLQCNIDETNEIMNKLHNEMGPAVVKTVTDIHKEILEDNRSGICHEPGLEFCWRSAGYNQGGHFMTPRCHQRKGKDVGHKKTQKEVEEGSWLTMHFCASNSSIRIKLERRKKLPL
jgi:hypothetical protein